MQMSPMTQQLLIPPLASHGGITVLSSARRPGPSSQQVGWRSSRRWLLASGGALAGAALAACAGGSPSPAPAAKPVAIDYWHIFGGTDTPTMDHMVAAFQASHPTITVNTTQIGFNDFTDKITVAFASGTPPNVFMNGPAPHASAYGILRQVKSVDTFAKRDKITPDLWLPALQPTFVNAGKMYGLRFNTDVRVLYYNAEAFAEAGLDPNKPPVSWDDLIDYAHKLTKKSGDSLVRAGWWPGTGQVRFEWLHWSNGGTLTDPSGSKVLFNDQIGVGTLDFVAKVADAVAPAAQYAEFAKGFGSNENDPFITGKLAMVADGSWLKATYDKYGGNLKYKAALLPYAKKQTSISGGFTMMIPASNPAEKDEASWELLKFLCTDREQQLFMSKTGQLSALVALQNDPFFAADPIMSVIARQMKATGLFVWQPPASKLGSALIDAKNGAINKKASSKELLETAAQITQTAMDDYNRQHPEWLQNFGK